MSVQEIQSSILALSEKERYELFRWLHSQEQDYGDVDPEAAIEALKEVWEEDEKLDAIRKSQAR